MSLEWLSSCQGLRRVRNELWEHSDFFDEKRALHSGVSLVSPSRLWAAPDCETQCPPFLPNAVLPRHSTPHSLPQSRTWAAKANPDELISRTVPQPEVRRPRRECAVASREGPLFKVSTWLRDPPVGSLYWRVCSLCLHQADTENLFPANNERNY